MVEVVTRDMYLDFLIAVAEFVQTKRKNETDYQACLDAEELGTSKSSFFLCSLWLMGCTTLSRNGSRGIIPPPCLQTAFW